MSAQPPIPLIPARFPPDPPSRSAASALLATPASPPPGDSRLDVQVRETNPFQVGLQWSNRRNPSVGSTAYDLLASDSDLTGRGDRLAVQYDIANGPPGDPQLAGADDFSLDYAIPFTP